MFILKLDGYDYSPWIKDAGLGYDDEDLDTENTVRVKTGHMRRDKITDITNMTYDFITMSENLVRQLFTSLRKPEFEATVHTPFGDETKMFYCSKRPASLHMVIDENDLQWDNISISIHEI